MSNQSITQNKNGAQEHNTPTSFNRSTPDSNTNGSSEPFLLTEEQVRAGNRCGDPSCDCHSAGGRIHCPAHDDSKPDLSISTENGKVLWHCFAGCSQSEVTAAIKAKLPKFKRTALMPRSTKTNGKPKPVAIKNFDYHENGALLFQTVRREYADGSKDFTQRRPGGGDEWVYNLKDITPVLYHADEVKAASTVIICEGEKAADAVNEKLEAGGVRGGAIATTNPMGAGKWKDSYSEALRGKHVAILPDADEPGRRHAEAIAQALDFKAASLAIVELPDLPAKGDAVEYFENGGTLEELFQIIDDAREVPHKPQKEDLAKGIPSPALGDDKGNPEYDPAQLVTLLHPLWKVQNLATHAAHAQRIRDHLGSDLCYSAHLGWLVYNGRYWQRDDKHATRTSARVAELTQAVRDEAATLYGFAATLAQAGRETDVKAMSKAATALLRHTKQVESKAFIEGALHLAAGLLAVETEQFDQKPWLIGFQNGTWDKGEWREHRREDFLLHLSPVHLDFDCDRSEWLATLDRITGGDMDFALMAQDVAGYVMSAASHLRLLPFLYGPKGTGKSTYTELLQSVLRDMSATIDPKKLQDSAARERLGADLWNRRLAVCSEAGSQRLEAELLKTLSGGDQLAVRFLFREAFTAPPRHVLLMVTNDPPKMDAYDAALKDRIIALPFDHPLDNGTPLELTGGKRIEAVRQDHESPLVRGFAAWAIEGLARVWQSQEVHRAKCAATATAQFWADTDQLTPFWETIEETELLEGIGKTELRERYETWCKTEGARPKAAREWTRACKEGRGLEEGRGSGGKRLWYLPKVTEVTKQTLFSNDTREEHFLPHGQFENDPCFVTSVTNSANGTSEAELEEVIL